MTTRGSKFPTPTGRKFVSWRRHEVQHIEILSSCKEYFSSGNMLLYLHAFTGYWVIEAHFVITILSLAQEAQTPNKNTNISRPNPMKLGGGSYTLIDPFICPQLYFFKLVIVYSPCLPPPLALALLKVYECYLVMTVVHKTWEETVQRGANVFKNVMTSRNGQVRRRKVDCHCYCYEFQSSL